MLSIAIQIILMTKNNNGGNQRNSQFIVLIFIPIWPKLAYFRVYSPFVREKYNLNRLDCLIIFQIFR